MVERDRAVGPVPSRTGHHALGLVEVYDVDSVDVGAGQTSR